MTALRDVQGIGPSLERQLHEAGYATVGDLAAADPNDLVAVRGVGSVSAGHIIAAAADLTSTSGARREPSVPKSAPDAEKQPSGAKKAKKKNKKDKNAKAGKKSNTAKAKKKKKKKNKKNKKKKT